MHSLDCATVSKPEVTGKSAAEEAILSGSGSSELNAQTTESRTSETTSTTSEPTTSDSVESSSSNEANQTTSGVNECKGVTVILVGVMLMVLSMRDTTVLPKASTGV